MATRSMPTVSCLFSMHAILSFRADTVRTRDEHRVPIILREKSTVVIEAKKTRKAAEPVEHARSVSFFEERKHPPGFARRDRGPARRLCTSSWPCLHRSFRKIAMRNIMISAQSPHSPSICAELEGDEAKPPGLAFHFRSVDSEYTKDRCREHQRIKASELERICRRILPTQTELIPGTAYLVRIFPIPQIVMPNRSGAASSWPHRSAYADPVITPVRPDPT